MSLYITFINVGDLEICPFNLDITNSYIMYIAIK